MVEHSACGMMGAMQGLSPDSLDVWLAQRDEVPSAECAKRAKLLIEGWIRHQRALNIVSVGTLETQVEACVAASRALHASTAAGPFVDVGSGGGFPGLWIAATWEGPGWLVEPRARRADFLELMLARMGRGDWKVARARWAGRRWQPVGSGQEGSCRALSLVLGAEKPGGREGSPGSVVSARAVWEPTVWWEEGLAMAGGGGAVMMHVRPGEPLPEGASLCAEETRDGWCVRVLRGEPGPSGGE